jgi:iron complex outermembrane receptor protein
MFRSRLSTAIHAALLVGSLTAPAAFAQQSPAPATPAADEARTLDAITVTARRREESLQEVPVAVTAFGEEDLKELQADRVDGLQGAVPNLNIVQGRGSSSAVNVFIRGIGQPDALQTFDPGVGVYVDDVYYSRIQGALMGLADVEQIEVLRGPQGTLYGKNSTGGAIKITTRQPGNETRALAELTVGSFGRLDGQAYVSAPLGERTAFSLAIGRNANDGYVEDPVTGEDYNGEDTLTARGKWRTAFSDDVALTLAMDHTRQDNALTLGRPTAPLLQTNFAGAPRVLLPAPTGEYSFQTRTSFRPDQGQTLDHTGFSATVDWRLGQRWSLKSITALRDLDTAAFIDIDASQFELGDVFVGLEQEQQSQELQFIYDNGEGVDAIFGAYYLNEQVPSTQFAYADDFLAFGALPLTFLRSINDDLETRSVAAFAHANWTINDDWRLSGGLRWTEDRKDYFRTTSTFSNLALLNGTFAFRAQDSWTALTPSVSLQRTFSDRVMGYVSANRGFKSGGFNGRANSAAEAANPAFKPEFVWTYELGLKTSSANGRLQGNVAVFQSDYEDFQARVAESVLVNGVPTFTFPVLNAGKLRIRGAEFEGVALLEGGTRFAAQVGWLDAEYREFLDLRTSVPTRPDYNPSLHDHVPFSPEWTARLAASHPFSLSNGATLVVGGDASYRAATWLSVDNRPGLYQEAYTLMGLFGSYDSPDGRWQLRAGVRNLTDEVYKTDAQEFSSVANIQTAYFGAPRNWYATFRYNFF